MAKRPAPTQAVKANGNVKRTKLAAPSDASKNVKKPAGILKKREDVSAKSGNKPVTAKQPNGTSSKGKGVTMAPSVSVAAAAQSKGKQKASIGQQKQLRLPLSEISKDDSSEPLKPVATAFEVVAGSYERILYGLHCSVSGSPVSGNSEVDMQPVFQFPAHLTCVKTACTSPNGRWLATGAADEVIKVWDLRRRKEVGGLLGHDGDITSLTFSTDKYLVSTSADGTLCLFRTKDWSMLRRFKGHKGPVVHAAVHPQGRVALSVGKDRCLRMWDLLGRSTGKSSTSTKLGAQPDLVRWNTKGDKFAVVLDREIRVYTINMITLHTLTSRSRFYDIQFTRIEGKDVLLVACEDGKVKLHDNIASGVDEEGAPTSELRCFAELVGHKNRVKAVSIANVLNQQIATSISTDGTIKVFPLASLTLPSTSAPINEPVQVQPISSFDTKGSRLTCLTAVAVTGDRTTAASIREVESEDDSDDDSEMDSEIDIDDLAAEAGLEGMEAEMSDEEADGLDGEDDEEEESDEEEGNDDEGEAEEWGGIEEE